MEATTLTRQVKRGPGFWIDLMLASLPPAAPEPPDGRVIEPAVAGVTDWLRRWHAGHRSTLAARLPAAWQQRFPAWLDAQRG